MLSECTIRYATTIVFPARFPQIQGPRKDDICYATQSRQDAVKRLAGECELVLVVGSPNSSNSNRLKEIADKMGRPSIPVLQSGGAALGGCSVGAARGLNKPGRWASESSEMPAARCMG